MNMNPFSEPSVLPGLLAQAESLKDEPGWEPFRPGIDVRWLYCSEDGGPAAALLRYQPGARTPLHEHLGYEQIIVLDGAQSDHRGHYAAGTLVINPPGSIHAVTSASGCVVLITWERRVRFLENPGADDSRPS